MNHLPKQTAFSASYAQAEDRAAADKGRFTRRLSFSSQVLPGILVGLDSLAVLSTAALSFLIIVGSQGYDAEYYAAAICFVWIVVAFLMNFAGLYRLEPIMSPLAFADKIIISFGSTFLFLLAAAFALKISTSFSRLWVSCFAASACSTTLLIRVFAARIVGYLADRRVFTRNVVVAGAGRQAQHLFAYVKRCNPRFITII